MDSTPYRVHIGNVKLRAPSHGGFVLPGPTHPTRRRLLKIGLAAAATLAVAGGVSSWINRPLDSSGKLSDAGRWIFKAVAAAVLEGSLPQQGPDREQQLSDLLERLDKVLMAFPQTTQREVAQLLALLANPVTRGALTGSTSAWDASNPSATSLALENMRKSSVSLRQQAYHALRDLTNAAYYADPAVWHLMGYPGPNPV